MSLRPAPACLCIAYAVLLLSLIPTRVALAAELSPSRFDPWVHCARVIDQDNIDDKHAGEHLPPMLVAPLRAAFAFAEDVPHEWLINGSNWRCMDGKVWACHVGANLPCWSKADTQRRAGEGARNFCRDEPDADAIPAYATGRETVYAWRCKSGRPHLMKQIIEVDPRGFPADFWHPIEPPSPTP